jgi:hypothetical protein
MMSSLPETNKIVQLSAAEIAIEATQAYLSIYSRDATSLYTILLRNRMAEGEGLLFLEALVNHPDVQEDQSRLTDRLLTIIRMYSGSVQNQAVEYLLEKCTPLYSQLHSSVCFVSDEGLQAQFVRKMEKALTVQMSAVRSDGSSHRRTDFWNLGKTVIS